MNTVFLLMAEYETTAIPLKTIAAKYFGITNDRQLNEKARHNEFPFPIFRSGGQKSDWMVSLQDLAEWLDSQREKAKHRFELLNNTAGQY